DPAGRVRLFERSLLSVAACFLEPIQGEGGVRPLAKEYLSELQQRCSSRNVPLVIDEIQSGMGRTGRFLACHRLGVRGDYYLLSKGLGGGLAKISALIISRRRYRPEFSMLHTSTFAEDDFSSAIAMRTLDILERGDWALLEECEQKGRYLRDGLRQIQERYPDVLKEVRGAGLMVGVEFQELSRSSSSLLRQLSAQADLVYCIAGYLLHEH